MDDDIFCKEAKITSTMLVASQLLPNLSTIKKGLILSLLKFKNSNGMSWPTYKNWIEQITYSTEPISLNALRKSVLSVKSQRDKIAKNVHRTGSGKLKEFLNEHYKLPGHLQAISKSKVKPNPPQFSSLDYQIVSSVNKSLATEIAELKEEVAADKEQLNLKEKKIKKAKLNCHNINRKLKRKEMKISQLLGTVDSLKHETKTSVKLIQKHTKSQSNLLRYYKSKCNYLSNQLQTFECPDCNELDTTVTQLKRENQELLEKNAELLDELKEKESKMIKFYDERKYLDNLRVCIMELLTHNVSTLKIEPVLQSVFKLLNLKYDRFPQRTTINQILIESRSLAHVQIAETLTKTSHNTLHSDGTTKFGHKYQGYQVTTPEGSLTLGIQVNF